jgi:hypothetical protein
MSSDCPQSDTLLGILLEGIVSPVGTCSKCHLRRLDQVILFPLLYINFGFLKTCSSRSNDFHDPRVSLFLSDFVLVSSLQLVCPPVTGVLFEIVQVLWVLYIFDRYSLYVVVHTLTSYCGPVMSVSSSISMIVSSLVNFSVFVLIIVWHYSVTIISTMVYQM